MFKKMLGKGLVTRNRLATRMGIETCEITVNLNGKVSKIRVNQTEVLKDLDDNSSDDEIMRKYKLSPRGLRSLLTKLHRKGLISQATLDRTGAASE